MRFAAKIRLRTIWNEAHEVEVEANSPEEAAQILREGGGKYVYEVGGDLQDSEVIEIQLTPVL